MNNATDPVTPGFPHPGTFRPRGLNTPPAVCSLPRLAEPVGSAAPMGFSLQGLAPPIRGTPLGASPLLPFKGPARRRNRRDFRGFSKAPTASAVGPVNREGERRASSLGEPILAAEPCPPGCSPLQGFLLRRLGARAGPSPSCPSTESAPYGSTLGRGFRGFACSGSGWPLSRLPALLGFCTSSLRAPLRTRDRPGLWLRLGGRNSGSPLRTATRLTGVRRTSRFGA